MSNPGNVDVTIEDGAAHVEAAEVVADATVEIAEIREDGETERARIAAELEQVRIDAAAGVASETLEARLDQCQLNIETNQLQTQGQITALTETLATELASIRQLLEERAPPQRQQENLERTDAPGEADQAGAPVVTNPKSKPIRVV